MFMDERTLYRFYRTVSSQIYKFMATQINFSIVFIVCVYLHT